MSDPHDDRLLAPAALACFHFVVWHMRFAPVLHNKMKFSRGEAARAPASEGEAAENQTYSIEELNFPGESYRIGAVIGKKGFTP